MSAWLRRVVLAAAVPAALVLGPGGAVAAPGASAHPFGDPQTADITSTAQGVQVLWKAAPDDVTALAMQLGVLEETRTYVFQDGTLVPAESAASDGVVLAGAPELVQYLLDHVTVRSGERACAGTLQPVTDVIAEGATLAFDCGGPVRDAHVELDLLVDLNDAYRTLANGPGGQRTVYSKDQQAHTWTFPASVPGPGGTDAAPAGDGDDVASSAALQLGGAVGALVLAGGAVVLWRRRRAA